MKIDVYDRFLNQATHWVAEAWAVVGGKRLDTDELYDLNDLLDGFFTDREEESDHAEGV